MSVVVVTPPEPIVTFEDAAGWLRLGSDQSQKTLVEGMIAAATAHIDGPSGWLGRSLGAQMLEARFDVAFYNRDVSLPCGPVTALVSASYIDNSGQVIDVDLASLNLVGSDVFPVSNFPWSSQCWRPGGVRVRYSAGSPENVVSVAKTAILLMVADLFDNRGEALINLRATTVVMSTTVENLLSPLRLFS